MCPDMEVVTRPFDGPRNSDIPTECPHMFRTCSLHLMFDGKVEGECVHCPVCNVDISEWWFSHHTSEDCPCDPECQCIGRIKPYRSVRTPEESAVYVLSCLQDGPRNSDIQTRCPHYFSCCTLHSWFDDKVEGEDCVHCPVCEEDITDWWFSHHSDCDNCGCEIRNL